MKVFLCSLSLAVHSAAIVYWALVLGSTLASTLLHEGPMQMCSKKENKEAHISSSWQS